MNCRMKSGNDEVGTLLPTRGILVIARSDSDKVIQCGASELDCFDLKLMEGRRRRRQRPLAWLRLGPLIGPCRANGSIALRRVLDSWADFHFTRSYVTCLCKLYSAGDEGV